MNITTIKEKSTYEFESKVGGHDGGFELVIVKKLWNYIIISRIR